MALVTEKPTVDYSNTRLTGTRLWIFRGIWIILALAVLTIEINSFSNYFKDHMLLCEGFCPPGYLWPEEAKSLSSIGLSAGFNAWYFLIFDILPSTLSLITIGLILAWLRSDDWLALYTSLFLISLVVIKLPFIGSFPWVWMELGFGIFVISSAPILMYIFPNGRFVPGWSRWLVIPVIAWMTYQIILPDNPWYVLSISMLFHLSGIGSLLYRYNHISEPAEKSQIKWVIWAFSIRPISEVGIRNILFPLIIPMATTPGLGRVFFHMLTIPVFSTLPFIITAVGLGIAIFRYRLWDIDLVINRSLVYGLLTVLLIALFSVSLLIINLFFQNFANGQLLALTISAAAFGALFHPARRRLQRFVDQRFYHIEIDYQKTPISSSLTNILKQTDFGMYQGLELIGRGGMAEVYKSIHPTLGEPVAIKILPAHLAADPDFQKRFSREAETVSKLQHPNIVRVFDYGEQQGTHYIVMEYLAGKDLSTLLKDSGKLTLSQALPIIRQIASALDYAHTQGLIHRDIKPSNIMLDMTATPSNQPRAVLTDFGIVKIINAPTAVTGTGGFLGTLDYIAPEQIQAFANIDNKADIYSFGVMVYEILTGELPFKHNNPGAVLIAHLNQPAPNACEVIPDLPLYIATAIQRAMEKKPDKRFETATELVMEMSNNGL